MSTALADGTPFPFWDDTTDYRRVWHVDRHHQATDDTNPGDRDRPLRTIAAAAARVAPGEKVVVHAGVYRECLAPSRGGDGPALMIAYEAAPGDEVVISAADRWQPHPILIPPSPHTRRRRHDHPPVFYLEFPAERLVGYNPFLCATIARSEWFPWQQRPPAELARAQRRRGLVIQDGLPLQQVDHPHELLHRDGTFYVGDDGLSCQLRCRDDADPSAVDLEFSARHQCIAPSVRGLGYIAIRGFTCQYAGNGAPFPQRGAISTGAGHHWIISGNRIRHVNALGIDIGTHQDLAPRPDQDDGQAQAARGHIVRGNHLHDIGLAGLAGVGGPQECLIEGNHIEDIGHLGLEHVYEAAAIKLHAARDVLIRANHIHRLRDCCGIWIDFCCANNRITGNRVIDLVTVLAGIYVEVSLEPNLVDRNLVADCRDAEFNDPPKDDTPGGIGIAGDMTDHTLVRDNCLVDIRGHYAIALHLAQKGRTIGCSTAMSRGHEVTGNTLVRCAKRIFLARPAHCRCDGNVFHDEAHCGYFACPEPEREVRLNLARWRHWFGHDRHSRIEDLPLQLTVADGVVQLHADGPLDSEPPPFFAPAQWSELRAGATIIL